MSKFDRHAPTDLSMYKRDQFIFKYNTKDEPSKIIDKIKKVYDEVDGTYDHSAAFRLSGKYVWVYVKFKQRIHFHTNFSKIQEGRKCGAFDIQPALGDKDYYANLFWGACKHIWLDPTDESSASDGESSELDTEVIPTPTRGKAPAKKRPTPPASDDSDAEPVPKHMVLAPADEIKAWRASQSSSQGSQKKTKHK